MMNIKSPFLECRPVYEKDYLERRMETSIPTK